MSRRREPKDDEDQTWGFLKSSGINALQLGAVVIFGTMFYMNTTNYQEKTDARFTEKEKQEEARYAETEKRFDDFSKSREKQIDQMTEMQKGQSAMLLEVKTMGVNMASLVDAFKETRTEQIKINDILRDIKVGK